MPDKNDKKDIPILETTADNGQNTNPESISSIVESGKP